jgi:hypothetical protein
MVLEEQLIGFLNALTNILYRLRPYLLPKGITLPELGNMSLKFSATQVLPVSTIVPAMQGNAMVINHSGSIDGALQMPIAFVRVELKL